MDVRDSITDAVRSVLADLGVDPSSTTVQLERPGNPDHGDWSTNVALASAKAAGRNFFLNDALQIFKACTNAATLRALDLNGFLFACEAINVRLAACNQSVGGNYLRLKLAREERSQPSKGSVPVTSWLQRQGAPQGDKNDALYLRSSRNSHSLGDRSPAHR